MGAVPKLYGVAASPFVATVLVCLEEASAEYELVPLDMAAREQRAPHHLARNPLGKIPAFEDGDLALFESRAISRYVLRKYAGDGSPDLLRECSLEESATVDAWLEAEAHQFHPPVSHILRQCVILPMLGGVRDQCVVDENVARLRAVLDVYEAQLGERAYLAGDFVSLADLAHVGFMQMLVGGTEYAALVMERANVRAWWERLAARPAVKKVAALVAAEVGRSQSQIQGQSPAPSG